MVLTWRCVFTQIALTTMVAATTVATAGCQRVLNAKVPAGAAPGACGLLLAVEDMVRVA
jgi:hypothetical protein